jgi:hypothetical protein
MSNKQYFASLFFLAFVCVSGALSQQAPMEPPDQDDDASARLRVWVFVGDPAPQEASIAALGADGSSLALGDATKRKVEAAYREVPAGKYNLELREGQAPVAQKVADFAKNSAHTLIAWRSNGKWNLGLFSDELKKGKAAERPLRILNFANGATTTIAMKGAQALKAEPDTVQEIKLPAKIVTLDISAKAPGAVVPARTLSDVDLSASPGAYVLVAPDYRGRLRPQVIQAGEVSTEESAAQVSPLAEQQ